MSKALKVGFQQVLGRHSPKENVQKSQQTALNDAVIGGGGEEGGGVVEGPGGSQFL